MSQLDQIVEQIAFGRESPKPSVSLGLYLSPEVIYLAETHKGRDGKVAVDHLVRIPIPTDGKAPGATATMSTDFLADPAKIAGIVRQSMSQLRWNSKSVRVTLSHHLGLLRYFSMPAVEKRFLRSAVPLEAKKYIPIPFDVLAHDFQSVALPPDAGGKARVGILIAVTQKKNIENVNGLLSALGLKLEGLEVAPLSTLRLWQAVDQAKDPSPYLHVEIDGGSVRIMVVDHGVPVFFREVFLGTETTLNDLRKIDLTGCLSFVSKQLGLTGLSRLRVSGNVPNLQALADAFSAETGLKAALQDVPKLLSIKSGDWGGYSALGASAFSLAPDRAALDLGVLDRVTEEERQTARDIMALGAVLAAALSVAGLAKSASYSYRVRELRAYQVQIPPDIRTILDGKSVDDVQKTIKDMQDQLSLLGSVTGRRPKISLLLREIIDAMPEKVWLSHIELDAPLQGADRLGVQILLRGHAQDQTVSDEQNLAFQFKENLLKEPHLGKAFDIAIELQNSPTSIDMSATPGMDPKALAQKLEDRTEFAITLRGKH